jgi:hypothetical protein
MSKKGLDGRNGRIKEDEISTTRTQLWPESLNRRDYSEYPGS